MDQEQYEAANEALHWVRVSFLQMERYAESFVNYAELNAAASASGLASSSDVTTALAATRAIADAHFLLNACAQAEKALVRAGRMLPSDRKTTIRSLRDVHEHWEQHKKSFESKKNAKSRAGLRFQNAHPEHLPWNFRFDGSGTWISALRIEDLWRELATIEAELHGWLSANGSERELPPLPERGEFTRPGSRVIAMVMATQNIVIDFEPTSVTS